MSGSLHDNFFECTKIRIKHYCYEVGHPKLTFNLQNYIFDLSDIQWSRVLKIRFISDTMFPLDDEGYYCADLGSHYVETWKAMEVLVDEGLAKSIGLSNFNRGQVNSELIFLLIP